MNLYFISYTDDDGESHDSFVRTGTVGDAVFNFVNSIFEYLYEEERPTIVLKPYGGEVMVHVVPQADGEEEVISWDAMESTTFSFVFPVT